LVRYVFECTRVCSISIDSPEACPFLKDILKSISKGKEKERVIAFRDLSSALEKHNDGKGVRIAIYLLENGVLPPLLAGLDKAARGDWILLQPDPIKPMTMQNLNKAVVYLRALIDLMMDTSSTKYVRQHAPNLLDMLHRICLQESFQGLDPAWARRSLKHIVLDTRMGVLHALQQMLHFSQTIRRQMAKKEQFLISLLLHVIENFDEPTYIERCLTIVYWASTHLSACRKENIAPSIFCAASKVLSESQSRHQLELIILLLGRQLGEYLPSYKEQLLAYPPLLMSTKALILCPEVDWLSKAVASVVVLVELEIEAGFTIDWKAAASTIGGSMDREMQKEMERIAGKRREAKARSTVLF
jgi:hypothetical protein